LFVLKHLLELSVDAAFAQEFINSDGLKLIASKIENDSWFATCLLEFFVWQT